MDTLFVSVQPVSNFRDSSKPIVLTDEQREKNARASENLPRSPRRGGKRAQRRLASIACVYTQDAWQCRRKHVILISRYQNDPTGGRPPPPMSAATGLLTSAVQYEYISPRSAPKNKISSCAYRVIKLLPAPRKRPKNRARQSSNKLYWQAQKRPTEAPRAPRRAFFYCANVSEFFGHI